MIKSNNYALVTIALLLLTILSTACSDGQLQITNTLSILSTQSGTIEPTLTNTLTPTLTPPPSHTPSLTITPSPIPTITPTLTPTPFGGAGMLAFRLYHREEKLMEVFTARYGSSEISRIFSDGYSIQGISPDGNLLLVAKETRLYVMTPGGEEVALLSEDYGYSAYWLPKINKIAYIADNENVSQIFLNEPDGSNPVVLTENKTGVIEIIPAFDGQGLYWEEGYRSGLGEYHTGGYWTSIDGAETKKTEYIEAISPDGSKFAYFPFYQEVPIINIKDPSKNVETQIDLTEIITFEEDYFLTPISGIWWASDNEKFLVELALCKESCDETRYYLFDYTGKLLQELPDLPKAYEGSWSPDSDHFLFGKSEAIISYSFTTNEITEWDINIPGDSMILDLLWLAKPTSSPK